MISRFSTKANSTPAENNTWASKNSRVSCSSSFIRLIKLLIIDNLIFFIGLFISEIRILVLIVFEDSSV